MEMIFVGILTPMKAEVDVAFACGGKVASSLIVQVNRCVGNNKYPYFLIIDNN